MVLREPLKQWRKVFSELICSSLSLMLTLGRWYQAYTEYLIKGHP